MLFAQSDEVLLTGQDLIFKPPCCSGPSLYIRVTLCSAFGLGADPPEADRNKAPQIRLHNHRDHWIGRPRARRPDVLRGRPPAAASES